MYLAIRVCDGQDRKELERHVGLVGGPALNTTDMKNGINQVTPCFTSDHVPKMGEARLAYRIDGRPVGTSVGENASRVGSCKVDLEIRMGVL